MNKVQRALLVMGLLLAIVGCMGRKALPEERPLTAQRGAAQWFVISGFAHDPDHDGRFTQAIVMIEEQEGQPFVNVFASQSYGYLPHEHKSILVSGADVTLSRKERLLALTLRSERDSTEVLFRVDRDEVFFRIIKNGELWASCRKTYEKGRPLVLDTLLSEPDILALRPSMGWSILLPEVEGMAVYTLQGGDKWLFAPSAQPRTTLWMDFQLEFGAHYFVQIKNGAKEGEYHSTCARMNGLEPSQLFSGVAYSSFLLYKSPHSAKQYPLYWEFQLPTDSLTVKVHPTHDEQEFPLKRSSFWMGAIEVTMPTNAHLQDKHLGKGNMFIFQQP